MSVPQLCDGVDICSGEVISVPFAYDSVVGPGVTFVNDSLFTITAPSLIDHDTAVDYFISLYDELGCRLDTLITLHFYAMPVVVIEDNACEGAGYNSYGFVIPKPETVGVDTLVRMLYLQSLHGCDSAVELHLQLIDPTLSIVSLTEDFCLEMSAELQVVTHFTDYTWSTGDQLPNITVTEAGFYSVTASQGNCTVSAGYHVEPCHIRLILPNTITPSKGDGLNDVFYIPEQMQQSINDFEIRIFNRWGEQVFYSTDKNFRWKGDFKGKTGYEYVYNYVIRYSDMSGKTYFHKGEITVL